MNSYTQVAMTNLKNSIFTKRVFMDITVQQANYPKEKKGENKFLKALNYNPFKYGKLEFADRVVSLVDEEGDEIQTLSPEYLESVEVGMLRSVVRSAPLKVPTNRYVIQYSIQTNRGLVQVLNDDFHSIVPVFKWLKDNSVAVADPMGLLDLSDETNLNELKESEFAEFAQGTEYEAPFQMSGSSPRP